MNEDMTTEIIVAVLGAGGLGAIIAAIINGIFSKRKLGAEATEIITKAAAGVVTTLQAELDRATRLVAANQQLHADDRARLISEHDAELDEVQRVLQAHVKWDQTVIETLAAQGITLPPAPPLLVLERRSH